MTNVTKAKVHSMPGWHFLQLPGPTNIPGRIRRAMDQPAIDHRGEECAKLSLSLFEDMKGIFNTSGPVMIFPSSGTGSWESAIVNTLSPGDKVLMFNTGHFSNLWITMARKFGLEPIVFENDWRSGPDMDWIETQLTEDRDHAIKAILVVHNETSNGVSARLPDVRKAMDNAGHPALLLVDTISSLGSMELKMDEWGIDVAIGGSQKGIMLPPGISFCAVSEKALKASKTAKLPRCYWDWEWMMADNAVGFFPYTPAILHLFGLREAINMLMEEGLDNVFARHKRQAAATRCAADGWGLEVVCNNPLEYSTSITAIFTPEGYDSDEFRQVVLDRFNMALGSGLARFKGQLFRVGHMGACSDLMLAGAISGIEMGMDIGGIPHKKGGATAAYEFLAGVEETELQRKVG